MQARDNEILNQEEVDTVGNNEEQFECRALRAENPMRTWQLWVWGMREGGVGKHQHLEPKYLGEQ